MSHSLRPHGLKPARLLCPWYSPGKNTGVGSHSLCQRSSWPRDRTQVSHIAGRFLTIWATREADSESICQCCSQFVLPSVMKWTVTKLLKGRYGTWFIPELNKVTNRQNEKTKLGDNKETKKTKFHHWSDIQIRKDKKKRGLVVHCPFGQLE